MYKTDAIVKFMQDHYTDEKLAALLAHAEDGKLDYKSCCCFIGIPTADHPLKDDMHGFGIHYILAESLKGARAAEKEFHDMYDIWSKRDEQRRQNLIPLIRAEMERRDAINNNSRLSNREKTSQDCPSPAMSEVLEDTDGVTLKL